MNVILLSIIINNKVFFKIPKGSSVKLNVIISAIWHFREHVRNGKGFFTSTVEFCSPEPLVLGYWQEVRYRAGPQSTSAIVVRMKRKPKEICYKELVKPSWSPDMRHLFSAASLTQKMSDTHYLNFCLCTEYQWHGGTIYLLCCRPMSGLECKGTLNAVDGASRIMQMLIKLFRYSRPITTLPPHRPTAFTSHQALHLFKSNKSFWF